MHKFSFNVATQNGIKTFFKYFSKKWSHNLKKMVLTVYVRAWHAARFQALSIFMHWYHWSSHLLYLGNPFISCRLIIFRYIHLSADACCFFRWYTKQGCDTLTAQCSAGSKKLDQSSFQVFILPLNYKKRTVLNPYCQSHTVTLMQCSPHSGYSAGGNLKPAGGEWGGRFIVGTIGTLPCHLTTNTQLHTNTPGFLKPLDQQKLFRLKTIKSLMSSTGIKPFGDFRVTGSHAHSFSLITECWRLILRTLLLFHNQTDFLQQRWSSNKDLRGNFWEAGRDAIRYPTPE